MTIEFLRSIEKFSCFPSLRKKRDRDNANKIIIFMIRGPLKLNTAVYPS